MTRRLHFALAVFVLVMGIAHVSLTAPTFGAASPQQLWFTGSGLAIVAVALLNLLALRQPASGPPYPLVIGNVMMTGFFGMAWPLVREPQVAVGFAAFLALTGLSLVPAKHRRDAPPISRPAIIMLAIVTVSALILLLVMSRAG